MDRSIVYSTNQLASVVDVAIAAERGGFRRIWVTETVGHDALMQSAAIAEHTERIGIGTGILYAFTRNPVALAVAAQGLANRSGGRFTLGIGAGTRGLRRRFGVEFDHPAPRLVEYADVVRQVMSGGAVQHAGRFYTAEVPAWGRQAAAHVPAVYGSGLNAVMLRHAARGFDGIALHPMAIAPAYLDAVVVPSVNEGAAGAGRAPQLAAWVLTSVADDSDAARRQAARALAFYFATPSYLSAAAGAAWEPAAQAVCEAFKQDPAAPDWDALGRHVTDQMIDELTLAGTPAEVRSLIPDVEARLAPLGVTELVLQSVSKGTDAESHALALTTAEALAPAGVRA